MLTCRIEASEERMVTSATSAFPSLASGFSGRNNDGEDKEGVSSCIGEDDMAAGDV
jgi:hypothetical protein